MKKYIILLALVSLGISFNASADIPLSSVPQAVVQSFQQKFPDATDVEWDKRWTSSNYEVEFEIGRVDYKALYNNKGELLRYWHDISLADLPEAVKKAVTTNYPDYRIDDAEMLHVINGNNVSVQYRIELDTNAALKSDKKVVFSKEGEVISSVND